MKVSGWMSLSGEVSEKRSVEIPLFAPVFNTLSTYSVLKGAPFVERVMFTPMTTCYILLYKASGNVREAVLLN